MKESYQATVLASRNDMVGLPVAVVAAAAGDESRADVCQDEREIIAVLLTPFNSLVDGEA